MLTLSLLAFLWEAVSAFIKYVKQLRAVYAENEGQTLLADGFIKFFFFFFWLHWVFAAAPGLSLVVASRGYS